MCLKATQEANFPRQADGSQFRLRSHGMLSTAKPTLLAHYVTRTRFNAFQDDG
jgi:hypothetical protein